MGIEWLNAIGVCSAFEMGACHSTHHMAALMLISCLPKRAQEAEGQEVGLQVELDAALARVEALE